MSDFVLYLRTNRLKLTQKEYVENVEHKNKKIQEKKVMM